MDATSGNDEPAPVVDVYTEYGTLRVTEWLFSVWQKYGWPTEEALMRMHAEQEADGGVHG